MYLGEVDRDLSLSDVAEDGLYKLPGGGVAPQVLRPHLARLERLVDGVADDLGVARQVHALQHVHGGEEDGCLEIN